MGDPKEAKDVFPEEIVVANGNESDIQEIGEDENMDGDVHNGTQEQQRVNANDWKENIAATMWTDAMHISSSSTGPPFAENSRHLLPLPLGSFGGTQLPLSNLKSPLVFTNFEKLSGSLLIMSKSSYFPYQ
ncbi:hypothetical protein F2Q70_00040590 [Brassica cretica]|uniref:Uncharacterized protein n=1 Tax=Brassica cretica TaxID=69181 RepID=A0A8S9K7R1_BRACR|nr:hypothetical protein F2Q70_00040590 [Brassica cretica]